MVKELVGKEADGDEHHLHEGHRYGSLHQDSRRVLHFSAPVRREDNPHWEKLLPGQGSEIPCHSPHTPGHRGRGDGWGKRGCCVGTRGEPERASRPDPLR